MKRKQNPVLRFLSSVHPAVWVIIGVLTIIAAVLRLYQLEAFITFLGDQGRDAIIMKRIVTLEDFPGIGPRSSVGFIYLGPFYFYLMAPFLALFSFNPAGPGYGVAILWVIGMLATTWILRREWRTGPAVAFLALVTFSYALVSLGRFSWNPNLLPLFSFATVYATLIALRNPRWYYALIAGVFLGISLQLHYLMLLVVPAVAIVFGWYLWKHRQPVKSIMIRLAAAVGGAIIVYAPFIMFEIKNNFLNLRGIPTIFDSRQFETEALYHVRLTETNTGLWKLLFQFDVPHWAGIIISLIFIGYGIWVIRKHMESQKEPPYLFTMLYLSVVLYVVLFGYIDSPRFVHYYTPIYLFVFAILASLPLYLPKKIGWSLMSIILVVFVAGNVQSYRFFWQEPNQQIERARSIAQTILDNRGSAQEYAIVSIPLSSTNHQIRYFLEIMGDQPIPEESTTAASEMFVLCFYEDTQQCNPLEEGQYQIAIMENKTIVNEIPHPPEVTIYKIIDAGSEE